MNPDLNHVLSVRTREYYWCLTHRKCAVLVGIMEMLGAGMSVAFFSYASMTYPLLKRYVELPEHFLSDDIIVGVLNTLAILSVYKILLGIALLEGTIFVKLHKIKFWLTSMLTYKVVECALIIGMQFAGCKSPEINMYFFASVFIRGMEMLLIYVFLEKESLRRLRLKIRNIRRASSTATSVSNLSTVVRIQAEEVERAESEDSHVQETLAPTTESTQSIVPYFASH